MANQKLWKFVHACCDSSSSDDPYVLEKVRMQHDLQLVKSRITAILDLQAPLFCMAKQMAQSSHAHNVEDAVYAYLESNLVWKKASDDPAWRPKPEEQQHARDIMDMCYFSRFNARHRKNGDVDVELHSAEWQERGQVLLDQCLFCKTSLW